MNVLFRCVTTCLFVMTWASVTQAQTYRYEYQTIQERENVTAYRLQYETVLEEREIRTQRPVWETQMRERRYHVAKPVVETSSREERYLVRKPVWNTEYRESSYDRVRWVEETEMRQQRQVVQKPVVETQERVEKYVVRKPVTETVMQTQNVVVNEQVTTMRTEYIDQGGFVDQTVLRPGVVRNRLRWLPAGTHVDPQTGLAVANRRGLHWSLQQGPSIVTKQRVYVPNVVARQVPQTQLVQKVVAQQTPVEVTRYQEEVVTRKVPVQVQRFEQVEQITEVPVKVRRPITERISTRTPVRTLRWVEQEVVRKVPVTRHRVEYQERVEQYPVKVLRLHTEVKKVRVPHTVSKWLPYTQTRLRPRTVLMKVPVDACGKPMVSGTGVTSRKIQTVENPASSEVPANAPSDEDLLEQPSLPQETDNGLEGPRPVEPTTLPSS